MAAFTALLDTGPPVGAVGANLQKERRQTEQRSHHQRAAVTVLDIGRVNNGVHQQTSGVEEDSELLALDFLPRIKAVRIDAAPLGLSLAPQVRALDTLAVDHRCGGAALRRMSRELPHRPRSDGDLA